MSVPHRNLGSAIIVAGQSLLTVALIIAVILLLIANQGLDSKVRQDSIVNCQDTNSNRAVSVRIFGEVLALPAIAHPQFITRANMTRQNAEVAKIRRNVVSAYSPHDCTAVFSR